MEKNNAMDLRYLRQFNNKSIKLALLHPKNVSLLEELLEKETRVFEDVQKRKLEPGVIPSTNTLPTLLEEVKIHVDSFLGVKEITSPAIDYRLNYETYLATRNKWKNAALISGLLSGGALSTGAGNLLTDRELATSAAASLLCFGGAFIYSILKQTKNEKKFREENEESSSYWDNHISLKVEEKTMLIPTLAHEYTHHVQEEKGIPYYNGFECFCEGQARSVQKQVGIKYFILENNPAFLLNSLEDNLSEYKAVYFWLMAKLRKTPNVNLFLATSIYENQGDIDYFKEHNKPATHALGNVFFSLLESREGTEIHKAILQGEYHHIP